MAGEAQGVLQSLWLLVVVIKGSSSYALDEAAALLGTDRPLLLGHVLLMVLLFVSPSTGE